MSQWHKQPVLCQRWPRPMKVGTGVFMLTLSKSWLKKSDDCTNQTTDLLDIDNIAYALDSITIDLCLALFPWARFRKAKGIVKMHTLLDLRGSIPTIIEITDGLCHNVNRLDLITFKFGPVYVMDMGYFDYERLYKIHKQQTFFVTSAKSNMAC